MPQPPILPHAKQLKLLCRFIEVKSRWSFDVFVATLQPVQALKVEIFVATLQPVQALQDEICDALISFHFVVASALIKMMSATSSAP